MFDKNTPSKEIDKNEVHNRLSQVLEKCSKYIGVFEVQRKSNMVSIPSTLAKIPPIYGLWKNGECVYIGRTRNLAQRLRGHNSKSAYSASFAVKRASVTAKMPANYTAGNSAIFLLANDTIFEEAFKVEQAKISQMKFSYIQVDDMIDQYFFEPYATMHFGLSENAFGTH